MFRRTQAICAVVSIALAMSLVSCSKTKTVTLVTAPATGALTIHFDHTVGGLPLVLNAAAYAGTDGAGNNYNVSTLRYFVCNIELHNTNGTIFGVRDYHFRDAAIPSTRDYVLTGIPPGTYDELSFTFGLDAMWNVSNNAIASDPNVAGMEWPPNWGGGWHYMMIEGVYDSTAGGIAYRTDTGRRFIAASGDSSGLGPDPVPYPHDFPVRLTFPTPLTVSGNNWATTVTMEVDGWYGNPEFDLSYWFPTGTENIMLNLGAQDLLEQAGAHAFSIDSPVSN